MNDLKITVRGGAKTGKSYLVSALKEIFKEVFTKVTVKGNVDFKTEDQISECYKSVVDSPITIEEVHIPTPTGNLIEDLKGLGFVLSHGKDYSNGNNGKEFLCMSLSISRVIDLEVSNDDIYIIAINSSNIGRPTLVGKYDFYKLINLINSLKALN